MKIKILSNAKKTLTTGTLKTDIHLKHQYNRDITLKHKQSRNIYITV